MMPIFLMGTFAILFDEFGIELLTATQLTFQFNSIATQTWSRFLPVCLTAYPNTSRQSRKTGRSERLLDKLLVDSQFIQATVRI